MSAFLRGLEEVYGQGVREKEREVEPEILPDTTAGLETRKKKKGEKKVRFSSRESISSGEMDDVYEEMIDDTKGEERSVETTILFKGDCRKLSPS